MLPQLAKAGDLAEMKRALAAEPERVNEVDEDGWSALMFAAREGNLPMVIELLSTEGIAVDLRNNLRATACHAAAR